MFAPTHSPRVRARGNSWITWQRHVITSYGMLKLLPFWDPLRGDPRFEQIVASFAPKEPSR